jgi:8-oxo-dGTP diphosphatase
MKEPQLVQVVSGCILEKDSKYLLVQEKLEKVYGLWNLPAGKVDIGETIEQAAVREVFEETGYIVELEGKISVDHSDINHPVRHIFKAKITGGELKIPNGEVLDAKWLSFSEIQDLYAQEKLRSDWVIESIEHVVNGDPT